LWRESTSDIFIRFFKGRKNKAEEFEMKTEEDERKLHFKTSFSFKFFVLGWNKQIRFQFPLYCSFFPWPEIWDSYQIKVQSNLWITNTLWIQKCSFCWPVVVALWQLNILNRTPKKVVNVPITYLRKIYLIFKLIINSFFIV